MGRLMGGGEMSQADWEIAKIICTQQQLRALNFYRRGYGKRLIGVNMNIDPSTARQHVRAGLRRIEAYYAARDAEAA